MQYMKLKQDAGETIFSAKIIPLNGTCNLVEAQWTHG